MYNYIYLFLPPLTDHTDADNNLVSRTGFSRNESFLAFPPPLVLFLKGIILFKKFNLMPYLWLCHQSAMSCNIDL